MQGPIWPLLDRRALDLLALGSECDDTRVEACLAGGASRLGERDRKGGDDGGEKEQCSSGDHGSDEGVNSGLITRSSPGQDFFRAALRGTTHGTFGMRGSPRLSCTPLARVMLVGTPGTTRLLHAPE
jgi:hypothetical protein